jgi:hypothetical protein
MLHLLDGKVVCKRCGAQLDIPDGHTAEVTFRTADGRRVFRVVKVDGEAIHECRVIVRRLPRSEPGWHD